MTQKIELLVSKIIIEKEPGRPPNLIITCFAGRTPEERMKNLDYLNEVLVKGPHLQNLKFHVEWDDE